MTYASSRVVTRCQCCGEMTELRSTTLNVTAETGGVTRRFVSMCPECMAAFNIVNVGAML